MELTNIEKYTECALEREYGHAGKVLFGDYLHERDFLATNLLEDIKSTFADGTDHGPRHILNVLENAGLLLDVPKSYGSRFELKEGVVWNHHQGLCSMHWLSLISSILYHDVGNVVDRRDHQTRIDEIYARVWGSKAGIRHQHRDIIRTIGRAHCGKAQDGSADTLKAVGNKIPFKGVPIRAQELAAVLRFADELAEGPQRTSQVKLNAAAYSPDSEIYHRYASATHVTIDKASKRIALTYYLGVTKGEDGEIENEGKLRDLLIFVFNRIQKLDEERQFTRHYTPLLDDFR